MLWGGRYNFFCIFKSKQRTTSNPTQWFGADCRALPRRALVGWTEQITSRGYPSSLQHREPSLKRQLRWSWKLFKAWQQAEIPSRAPPFTLQTLAIFCGWAHSTKRWGCKWLFMVYYEQVICCKYQQSTLRASSSISIYIWGRQRRRFEMPMLTRFILRVAKSHFFCRHGNQ